MDLEKLHPCDFQNPQTRPAPKKVFRSCHPVNSYTSAIPRTSNRGHPHILCFVDFTIMLVSYLGFLMVFGCFWLVRLIPKNISHLIFIILSMKSMSRNGPMKFAYCIHVLAVLLGTQHWERCYKCQVHQIGLWRFSLEFWRSKSCPFRHWTLQNSRRNVNGFAWRSFG